MQGSDAWTLTQMLHSTKQQQMAIAWISIVGEAERLISCSCSCCCPLGGASCSDSFSALAAKMKQLCLRGAVRPTLKCSATSQDSKAEYSREVATPQNRRPTSSTMNMFQCLVAQPMQ